MAQNNNSSISTTIRLTGFAIRDWLGPYYTLGCLVAVAIGFCAIIDASGWLVRGLTGALVFATLIAWCLQLVRSRKPQPTETQNSDGLLLPQILLAVTLFFCIGLVISEFILHGKRPGLSFPTSTETSGPAPAPAPAPTPTPVPIPAPTPTAASPVASATAAAPEAPASVAAQAPSPAPAPATPAAPVAVPAKTEPASTPVGNDKPAPKKPTPPPAQPAPSRAPERTEQPVKRAPAAVASGDSQRCSQLIQKFSLGQNLSDADKQYLETSCR
ncbi:hypothetical protein [Diaphorobacter caeni]|uniref:hypothetical protein n=1 Tax=Diaphorobacter caeni TaxID=2784387 RepID=UPI00188E8C2D|nr:hypothetical protein [Diaphorobacter caeni]MBF5006558.1 hypothetical protein [Diaphorobacter caeni]